MFEIMLHSSSAVSHCWSPSLCSGVGRAGAAVPAGGGEALPVFAHLQPQPQHPGGGCRSAAEPGSRAVDGECKSSACLTVTHLHIRPFTCVWEEEGGKITVSYFLLF